MFDITSSKLLILAIVALIVVGPKDLPILLRTVGKYLGMIRRQAAEFRHQFDEAMREAELDALKKEFDSVSREVHATVESGARGIEAQIDAAGVKPEEMKFGTGMQPAQLPTASESTNEAAAPEPVDTHEREQEPGRGAA